LTKIALSSEPSATAPCPVPCAATLSPLSRAKPTTLETSSLLSTKATANGR